MENGVSATTPPQSMNISLRQLQVFAKAAELLSFTRAAEALHLSQPAVSMQVRQLEDSLGLPLFEQVGKKLQLTQAGEAMERYALDILGRLDEARTYMEELKGLRRGLLTIAVASTLNQFASRILAAFVRQYPGVRVKLEVSNREQVLQQLMRNQCDLALMGTPPRHRLLAADRFMDNPLVIIAPADHWLVHRHRIALEKVVREPFVMRETGSGTFQAFQQLLESRGLELADVMEMNNNEAIKQSVAAGLGLGVVSLYTIEQELNARQLAVLDVESLPIHRFWHLVRRQGKRLSQVATTFRDFVLKQAPHYMPPPDWHAELRLPVNRTTLQSQERQLSGRTVDGPA